MPYNEQSIRPVLDADTTASSEAISATTRFVAELQADIERRDADIYNRHFSADVMWGSPYGERYPVMMSCMPSTLNYWRSGPADRRLATRSRG